MDMKRFSLLIILFSFLQGGLAQTNSMQPDTRKVTSPGFKVGEYLKFRIHYGIIDAGVATLEVKGTTTKNGRSTYHMIGKGKSVGMAEWFFKTRDTYQTYMDTEKLVPVEFIRDVNEGGYKINRHLTFDHESNEVKDILKSSTKTYPMKPFSQDLLSTFYYSRCLPTGSLTKGKMIPVDMFLDYDNFAFGYKFIGTAMLKTKWGKVRCQKFIPVVQSGRVFDDKESLTIWVTDDANRIPMRLEADLLVGSIKIDLVDYKNIITPIKFY